MSRAHRRRLLRTARRIDHAPTRTRYMIVFHLACGKRATDIADAMGCSLRTVGRVRRRWLDDGETGLIDRREDNAPTAKVTDEYIQTLLWMLEYTSIEHGHRRPTWTLRLMCESLARYTGIRVSRSALSRLLRKLGIGHNRGRPAVRCPWLRRRKQRRIRRIHHLINHLPDDEAAVWEDEVDIDLNPRIGFDWMLPGQQREVLTPGQNVKRYLAGTLDATTGRLIWVRGRRKNSTLFIAMLRKLLRVYADKKRIHVILDNYSIHSSKQTRAWLAEHGQRIRLHFLPPYCPNDNAIERRVWRELHANVTYHHQCSDIDELMNEATAYLIQRSRQLQRNRTELRKAI